MGNVDIEIYLSQLINFLESNPNDLIVLIGEVQKDLFYQKLRERCEQNFEKGEDFVLTRQQMIDIIMELKIPEVVDEPDTKTVIEGVIEKTKFGDIFLN